MNMFMVYEILCKVRDNDRCFVSFLFGSTRYSYSGINNVVKNCVGLGLLVVVKDGRLNVLSLSGLGSELLLVLGKVYGGK